uniref:Uncharacterized protein n=1 Tax=Arundo donax TaxID=35708 RepID=A0A0A9GBP9_ARUDO
MHYKIFIRASHLIIIVLRPVDGDEDCNATLTVNYPFASNDNQVQSSNQNVGGAQLLLCKQGCSTK